MLMACYRPVSKWQEYNTLNYCIDCNQTVLNNKDQQVHIVSALGQSVLSVIALH